MMTRIKRKLAHAISKSDVRKLRHSGRIASEVSPPRNFKSPEVTKDEGPKALSFIDLRYYNDHQIKDTWHSKITTSVKLIRHFRYVKIKNTSDM
jgi:hypothetical protein